MKRLLLQTLASLFLFLLQSFATIVVANSGNQPGPQVAARAWILIDADSGQQLAKHNAHNKYPVASLNKLMTIELVLEKIKAGELKTDDTVTINHRPLPKNAAQLYLRNGEHVDIETLLHGTAIHSANDAARSLAEHLAKSEQAFADLMNKRAQQLGMSHSHFSDATGLDHKGQGTSAHDLAMLARHIAQDHSEFFPVFSQKKLIHNILEFYNRNTMLWQDNRVTGIKTGYTRAAGYCIAASATRDDSRLIAVILGADNEQHRITAAQQLLDYGFNSFTVQKVYNGNTTITRIPLWMGSQDSLAVGVKRDLYVTLVRGRRPDTHAELLVNKVVYAPVEQGQQIGLVSITLDGSPLKEVPLIALESVDTGGVFNQIFDSIRLWFH
jgi:D-alanyl-D-alanine carboxypeptidase (penicillin-binding protein 5/6)